MKIVPNTPLNHALIILGMEGFLRREANHLTEKQGKGGIKENGKQV